MEYQDLDNDFNPNSFLIFLFKKKILFWIGMYTDIMSYASPNKWYNNKFVNH